jgi:hypothetical protein
MISSESERRAAGGAMHGLCRETIVELEGDVWTGRRCIRTIEHAREKVGTPETSRWTVEVERLQALGLGWAWPSRRQGPSRPMANNNDRTAGWGARHLREAISRFDERTVPGHKPLRPAHACAHHSFPPVSLLLHLGIGGLASGPRGSSNPITNGT